MSNAIVMVERNIRLSTRNVEALLTAVMLPILILVLFVYLFGGAIQTGLTDYVDYALPGVLLLCTGFVSALTATRVSEDLHEGIVDRFRSLGVGGAAMLGGHVAGSVLRNAVSITLLIAVALLIGFSPNASAAEWLLALAVLVLFVFAISWLAAVFGLLAKTPDGTAGFQFFIMFLPYPSSAFVPVETMPTWLHWFAENQPATPVIETVRGLLLGTPIGSSGVLAVAWCAGIAGVSMLLAALLFRRRVR